MGGVAYLFLGQLNKLYFDHSTTELDRMVLSDTLKRRLDAPAGTEPDEVFGHFFVLRYSEIKTLNVVYADQNPAS